MSVDIGKLMIGDKVKTREGCILKVTDIKTIKSEAFPFLVEFDTGEAIEYTDKGYFFSEKTKSRLDVVKILKR